MVLSRLETLTAGVASDALKVAEYRSALRLRSQMLQAGAWSSSGDEAAYKNFSRILSKACDLSPIIVVDEPASSFGMYQPPIPFLLPAAHQLCAYSPGTAV